MINRKIVLDPGHGGRDPGAVANGLRESELNLKMAFFIRNHLTQNFDGHATVMTRVEDISPANRLAQTVGADRYYDLHFNAFHIESASGFETFIFSGGLLDPGVTKRMQKTVHNSTMKAMSDLGIRNRGKKKGNYWAIRNARCASLLIEYLFITNVRESTIASNDNNLQKMAIATAEGIAKDLELPQKRKDDTSPFDSLPNIQRRIAVRVNNEQTDIVGYLINNRTYLPMLDVGRIAGLEVTGRGDYIDIRRG